MEGYRQKEAFMKYTNPTKAKILRREQQLASDNYTLNKRKKFWQIVSYHCHPCTGCKQNNLNDQSKKIDDLQNINN